MHNIKYTEAQETSLLSFNIQNIKETIRKTNVAIWFNKICKSG